MKIGKDWAGYAGAAAALAGNQGASKALAAIQSMKERKRDRSAAKEGAAIWRSYTSENGNVNDND
tara:strand:- start:60 stop:254 length:195 start_codon:yes stop_codon:yes gene_type:complete